MVILTVFTSEHGEMEKIGASIVKITANSVAS